MIVKKARHYTNMILDGFTDGTYDPEAIAEMCLQYMSEADVEDMLRSNDCLIEDGEDEE